MLKIQQIMFGSRKTVLVALLLLWAVLPVSSLLYGTGSGGHLPWHDVGERILLVLLFAPFSLPFAFGRAVSRLVGGGEIGAGWPLWCAFVVYWGVLVLLHMLLVRRRQALWFGLIALVLVLSFIFNKSVMTSW